MGGGDKAEGGGGETGEEGKVVEGKGESKVDKDSECEEEWGGAGGLARDPFVLIDEWVIN